MSRWAVGWDVLVIFAHLDEVSLLSKPSQSLLSLLFGASEMMRLTYIFASFFVFIRNYCYRNGGYDSNYTFLHATPSL